jgi:hypothetical protein
MRFHARTPRLLLALCIVLGARPALAEEFALRQLTENVDLALGAGKDPTGELAASFGLGPLDLTTEHVEFMGGMACPYLYGKPANNPLARSSLVTSQTKLNIARNMAMPAGLSFGLDEWDAGNRNLRLIAQNGVQLPELRLDHRLTVTNSFAVDGSQTRSSAGRLALGFDVFGGRHEGVAEYGAAPLAQLTGLRMNSQWTLDAGAAAVVGVTHRPLEALSAARIGLRQPLGAFALTTDMMADSAGGYTLGFRFSLPLGRAPERRAWSLSDLAASLRAERQPVAIAGSDAAIFDDAS